MNTCWTTKCAAASVILCIHTVWTSSVDNSFFISVWGLMQISKCNYMRFTHVCIQTFPELLSFALRLYCMYCWIISWLYHFSLPCISCAVNPWWWLHIVTLVCDIELTFCSYQENSFNSAGMVEYCIRMNGWLEKSYTESMKNDRHWAETSDKRSSFSSPLCDVNTLCSLFCFLLAF